MCGWALAHAKSGDATANAGYCGKSEARDEAFSTFAGGCSRTSFQRSPPNNAFALPFAICAAIFGGNCASQARYPAMMSP